MSFEFFIPPKIVVGNNALEAAATVWKQMGQKALIVTDPMMVYSGCYCNVSVNFYAFNANGNRGVAAGLGNIQFVKDGERLSGKASADADFDALEDDGGDVLGDDTPDYLS